MGLNRTSIIPGLLLLLLAVGGHARHIHYEDDTTSLQPILSQTRRTRICTELCMSGLGGTPCGASCYDLVPTNLPLSGVEQEHSTVNEVGSKYNVSTRKDACSVLCRNKLGFPLCECNYENVKSYDTDFVQVCSSFCVNYNYQIQGCQNCTLYKKFTKQNAIVINTMPLSPMNAINNQESKTLTVVWPLWCNNECSNGNGGAACNCDLLP